MELKCRALLTAKRIERFVISAHRRSSVVELSFVNPSKDNQFEWRYIIKVYIGIYVAAHHEILLL